MVEGLGCQPHAPAAFTPRDIPGTHFHEGLSRPHGHGLVGRKYVTEKSSDTTERCLYVRVIPGELALYEC
jgi:hypothetical protein